MHLTIHLDAEPYKCAICGNSFSWADCIKTHICRLWMMIHTSALSVERASARRATSKPIFPAQSQEESMTRKYAFFTLPFFSNRMGVYRLQRYILHYIILNNGILKSNSSIFLLSEGYITQYILQGVHGLIVNENNEVNISLMIV